MSHVENVNLGFTCEIVFLSFAPAPSLARRFEQWTFLSSGVSPPPPAPGRPHPTISQPPLDVLMP